MWTPEALGGFLIQLGAEVDPDNQVKIAKDVLEVRRERGGNRRISGYKINPLFFIYTKDCVENADCILFNINDVRQLNPTIAGKMFFDGLDHAEVLDYYSEDLK